MNVRHKLLVPALAAVLVVAIAAAASGSMLDKMANTTPQERAAIQTAFMKSKLGLQDPELAKVAAINLEYAEKAEPIIKGSEGPFIKMRKIQELQNEKDGKLQGVLSAAQFEAYQASSDEMKQKFEQEIEKKAAGGS